MASLTVARANQPQIFLATVTTFIAANAIALCYYFGAMSRDDLEDDLPPEEDAYYEADYDEDTIDYELDAEELLEEEPYESSPSNQWETITPDDAPLPNLDPNFELDSEGDFRASDAEPPWSEYDTDVASTSEIYREPWPLGLIAAAVLALVLLAAGGYGVIQQRTAMTEEIRQLQADLATTASKQEVADTRQSQRATDARNADLQSQIDTLQQENQNLQAEISSLKTLLASAEAVVTTSSEQAQPKLAAAAVTVAPDKPADTTKPVSTPTKAKASASKPVAQQPSARTWFVNFGSYSKEATAKKWASELNVSDGELIVIPGKKGSSQLYRVRVVDLPSRAIAEKIATNLEKTYSLPKLWVGQQ